ncbi:MAG TPA: flavin reductase family protein [Burkholderiaceae bacterium]|nr:flavin reductase family protein [Burkholderiaceae bacterium]
MSTPTQRSDLIDAASSTAPVGERDLRTALGQFATGVTVVTALGPSGEPVGLTVSSFNSVSLAPPLVLWSLGCQSRALDAFRACSHYAINVLAANQLPWALQFAARDVDRFASVRWTPGLDGVPLLEGTLATFECINRSQYPAGDHIIFVGEVRACRHTNTLAPLLYHRGKLLDDSRLDT